MRRHRPVAKTIVKLLRLPLEELRTAAKKVGQSKLYVLKAADHGYAAPKANGRKGEDVWQEAVTVLLEWLDFPTS